MMRRRTKTILSVFSGVWFFACILSLPTEVYADSTSDLQTKIDAKNSAITDIQKEIAAYQIQIDALSQQSSSLKNTLASLDISKKKLEATLSLTQNKITEKNLEINQLGSTITLKQNNIEGDRSIVAETLATIAEKGAQTIPEIILSSGSFSDAWMHIDHLTNLETDIRKNITSLQSAKSILETNKILTEKKKADLVSLGNELAQQRKLILDTTAQKNTLLAQTKDTEANYKKLLADKLAKKLSFEQELATYQNALHLTVNPNYIPSAGSGVLSWPLDHIVITQYFGDTDFATKNPQIYNGHGHTGVDFAASIGTPVKSALAGTVIGVGNTDLISGCYSFGKWVMVRHNNGLSTLYAHLSLPIVTEGQSVDTGQLVGYSGATGYATGPHLHFGVYATQGTQITTLTNSKNCRNAVIPIADLKAYLNPLSYL
jgi:murein DD-endopeptidase MepM/ murein hydrolase activator NlpD